MKYKTTQVAGTIEILASKDFTAIPFTVTETTVVKAGQPMTLAGKKATYTAGTADKAATTTADGILLYDVDPTVNPNGALLIGGVIDGKKAASHSGVAIAQITAAGKAAVPGVNVRENIGTKVTTED